MADDHVRERDIPIEPRLREGESYFGRGKNNQLIIFGRDRPAGIESGYGSEPGAGTIHIVVGRKGRDPSFKDDSSFIYTTMRTNVDRNLDLSLVGGAGRYDDRSGAAIIIKSDNVRLVHRGQGDVRISSDDGRNFIVLTSVGCEVRVGASWMKVEDGVITVQAGMIRLGSGASENRVILGDDFMNNVFNTHTHQSPVGPTSRPLLRMTEQHLSQKSKVE